MFRNDNRLWKLSYQFQKKQVFYGVEDMVLITDIGYELLTKIDRELK